MTWWFEDAVVGRVIEHPRGRTVTADEHARLAWLTDNASAVHGDIHRAAMGVFGQTVVLGALSAAITIGLAEPATAQPADAARALPRGWSRIALTAPVVAGDTLAAVSRIEAVTPDISSTEIRQRLRAGESIAGLVPEFVATYIAHHRLYVEAGL